MQETVSNLRARFGTTRAMAQFFGVELVTVQSWASGIRKPSGEAAALIDVLVTLAHEAPDVFAFLVGCRAVPKRPTVRQLPQALPTVPTGTPSALDAMPAVYVVTDEQRERAKAWLRSNGCPDDMMTPDMVERAVLAMPKIEQPKDLSESA